MSIPLAVEVIGISITMAAIGMGIIKLELSRPWKFIAAFLDYALLLAGLVLLGPIVGMLLGISGIAAWILVTSVKLAMEYDEVATDAAIHWRVSREQAKNIITRLRRSGGKPFQYLGPLGTAHLAAALAKCARSPEETEAMAKPIAMLAAIFHKDPSVIAPRLDRLMRRFREPAERAPHIADVITRASQLTPGSFDQVIDGLEAL